MLATGTQLGPYEIQDLLGSGGMGEVYRARDPRLGREVAIKVLSADFAADGARLQRFEQEARTLAALNHPNLMAVYDVGRDLERTGGTPYLVTELLVGETLQARLLPGPVGPRQAVDWGRQIASGLAAAHDRGIVHRDLKPGNIFITREGRAKILDFGLARLTPLATGAEDATLAGPASGSAHTMPGMTLGTVGYMAPEQVRGEPADARADIFAFGAVLYEMLTGAKPFARTSAADTMSAILRDDPAEPPPSAPMPPALDRIVRRCLEKQPSQRFQSASDLGFALEATLGTASSSGSQMAMPAVSATKKQGGSPGAWRWLALGAVAALIAGGIAVWMHWPHGFDLGELKYTPFSFMEGGVNSPVWSPDGKAVAYGCSLTRGQPFQICVRYLSSPAETPLTHGTHGSVPFAWTPDSGRILFTTTSGVFSVSVTGGQPTQLLDTTQGVAKGFGMTNGTGDMTLSPDGTALVGTMTLKDGKTGLAMSSPPGEAPRALPEASYVSAGFLNQPTLSFAPDGHSILMFDHSVDRGRDETWLIPWPVSAGSPRLVLAGMPQNAITPTFSWLPDSRHIVLGLWNTGGLATQLWLVDTESGTRTAISAADRTLVSPAVSPDGNQLIYVDQVVNFDSMEVTLRDGHVTPLLATPRNESTPAWAAKAPLLAYVGDRSGPVEIWLHTPGAPDRPLLPESQTSGSHALLLNPAPSPDGARVIYGRIGSSGEAQRVSYQLWIAAVSGGTPQRLTNNPTGKDLEFGGDWSPDGSQFALLEQTGPGNGSIAVVATGGQAAPRVLATDSDSYLPTWSPTGQWIAYRSDDANWKLLSPDGSQHRDLGKYDSPAMVFSRDGQTLYGIRPDGKADRGQELFSVPLTGGPAHVITVLGSEDAPQSLSNPGTHFTLSPDGQSLTYSVQRPSSGMWLVSGFKAARH